MKIVLVSNPVEENRGKYRQLTLSYETDGKTQERKLVSFNHKEVYNLLSKASMGDAFNITLKKGDKYWEWVEAVAMGKEEVSASAGMPAKGKTSSGNWETPEERAAKQVYIVRQSSIANAVQYCMASANQVTVEEVIDVAKKFEAYVFSKEEVKVGEDNFVPGEID